MKGGRQGDEGREHRRLLSSTATSCNRPDTTMEGLPELSREGSRQIRHRRNASHCRTAGSRGVDGSKDAEKRGPSALAALWLAAAGCDRTSGIGPCSRAEAVEAPWSEVVTSIFGSSTRLSRVVLYSVEPVGIDPDSTNVNGGSIAIGHPSG